MASSESLESSCRTKRDFSLQNASNRIDEAERAFWDPPVDNRSASDRNDARELQEQVAQAAVRIRELECELKRVQKVTC